MHLLHIGKTGGTALQYALQPYLVNQIHAICLHSHECRLRDVPRGEWVVFFLRDPVTRFVSGFNSRQRQGLPRHFVPWRTEETRAFSHFDTANKLALALSSEVRETREMAEDAMRSIAHVRSHYWDWFDNEQYFLTRLDDIVFIGFQERLEKDFQQLKLKLHIPDAAMLPVNDTQSHRSPAHVIKILDAQAVANLRQWYHEDYSFINICQELLKTDRLSSAC